jgi:hypothetical protein
MGNSNFPMLFERGRKNLYFIAFSTAFKQSHTEIVRSECNKKGEKLFK